jgi:hypothetical protein
LLVLAQSLRFQKNARAQKWDEPQVLPIDKSTKQLTLRVQHLLERKLYDDCRFESTIGGDFC